MVDASSEAPNVNKLKRVCVCEAHIHIDTVIPFYTQTSQLANQAKPKRQGKRKRIQL